MWQDLRSYGEVTKAFSRIMFWSFRRGAVWRLRGVSPRPLDPPPRTPANGLATEEAPDEALGQSRSDHWIDRVPISWISYALWPVFSLIGPAERMSELTRPRSRSARIDRSTRLLETQASEADQP